MRVPAKSALALVVLAALGAGCTQSTGADGAEAQESENVVPLRAVQDEETGSIAIYREGEDEPMDKDTLRQWFYRRDKPEDIARAVGRDYFHNPGGEYWRRESASLVTDSGPEVKWQTVYGMLDADGNAFMTETQNWTMRAEEDRFILDLEWAGEAHTEVSINEMSYGGMFLRMPWHKDIKGEAVNAARQRNAQAEGQRAMWVDVGMQVEGRDDFLHVAIFDHPMNAGAYSTAALWGIAQQEARQEKFLTADEAVDAMTVRDGFTVNAWASEPMITQPMAFAWDDRGRMWIAENRDYETRGRGFSSSGDSRILILEDMDRDGEADSVKVFAEGIPFPAALAVGFDGVFVGAPPNLLYLPDRDGDDVADTDQTEILLTGWGIRDRHETINSFHWGPDGWLYGLEGFATPSKITKPTADTKLYGHNDPFPEDLLEADGVDINGGVWRYHPTKKRFEVVAHGFSNPWGIDYDAKGQIFITACVIPHLFHVVPGGIYHRQGGQHFNPYVYGNIRTNRSDARKDLLKGMRAGLEDQFEVERPDSWAGVYRRLKRDRSLADLAQQVDQQFGGVEAARQFIATLEDESAPTEDRRRAIQGLAGQQHQALAGADPSRGEAMFSELCGVCHQMFGEGALIGPDLTGSNRTELDCLLTNIIDPSGDIQDDYRTLMVTTRDGRTYSGTVAAESDRALTLRVVGQDEVVIAQSDIQSRDLFPLSMMPEGLLHAWMSLAALEAGKHVICTVPMATTIEDCRKITEKVEQTGLKYMMAETVVYSREFLFIKELCEKGELGEIQHLAASHPQDMDGWPSYWERMIPMHYATHVVSPCLGLVDGLAEYVSCFGSGRVRDDIASKSGNRFAVETCHIKVKDRELVAHIWRFLYDVARQYRESFDVYGTKKSFEWTLVEDEPHVLHTAKKPEPEIPEKVEIPDYAHLLPEEVRKFTLPQEIQDAEHLSFIQGGGHGGSHPHLVNEFLSALREDRDPRPNAVTSANWTCVGICAHESATKGGEIVRLPDFTLTS